MSKYPFVYLLRDDKYKEIDSFFEENKDKLNCTVEIISTEEIYKLNNMFDPNYHILITYGENNGEEYSQFVLNVIPDRMTSRWIHKRQITNVHEFNGNVNYCYIDNVIKKREETRAKFSIFTTCYKSYDKIKRAYHGLVTQTLKDWEWIILDDSPEDEHFDFLRNYCKKDKRIRLYKRDCNSGNIGNVKNEAIGLCRGKYVLELDHDDIILPTILMDAYNVFESDKDIGFVYADFINMYEDGRDYSYKITPAFGKGYAGYYKQKIQDKWVSVCITPNINNISTSHLVCLPNHPRMWRRKTLLELENYSEFLPICDDFEILLRTMCNTKIAKIHKAGYIQFMNDDANNFSLIRNGEINRLGPYHIQPQFYEKYDVNNVMKEKNAYEDKKYINGFRQNIWKRNNYDNKKCNITVNNDFDKQYCLIGFESLFLQNIKELYKNPRNDFILLCNHVKLDELTNILDQIGYDRMKCYYLDCTNKELENYFHLLCKYTDNYEIIRDELLCSRHSIINKNINNNSKYLEIGIEHGCTFLKINTDNKIGVDPDASIQNDKILKITSDEFFTNNKEKFDVIFIDGMHQADYVLRDFNNAISCLNEDGVIFIDDIAPETEEEQYKIPINHKYSNNILKTKDSWTGDVWKVMYYILKNHREDINFKVFLNPMHRGIGKIQIENPIDIPCEKIDEIEKYDYNYDFNNYMSMIIEIHNNTEFLTSTPFNHIVIDNFVDNDKLLVIEKELREMNENNFQYTGVPSMPNVSTKKYCIENMDICSENIKQMINDLNSEKTIKYLEKITGIKHLQPDNFLMGGGIHKIKKGGHLNIHADFNIHGKTKKYRRLNLLLYMNSDYKEEYNGHLELWSKDMSKCEKKIAPIFNRAIIFRTTDDANHGHPEPWKADYDRLSIAMYYYTDDRPEYEKSDAIYAQWKTPKV